MKRFQTLVYLDFSRSDFLVVITAFKLVRNISVGVWERFEVLPDHCILESGTAENTDL